MKSLYTKKKNEKEIAKKIEYQFIIYMRKESECVVAASPGEAEVTSKWNIQC